MAHLNNPGSIHSPASPTIQDLAQQLSPITQPVSPPPELASQEPPKLDQPICSKVQDNSLSPESTPTAAAAAAGAAAEDGQSVLPDKALDASGEQANDNCKENDEQANHNNQASANTGAASSQPDLQANSNAAKAAASTNSTHHYKFDMALTLHRFSIDSLIEGALEAAFFDMVSI